MNYLSFCNIFIQILSLIIVIAFLFLIKTTYKFDLQFTKNKK